MKPADVEDFKYVCSWNTAFDEADISYTRKTSKFDVSFSAKKPDKY